MSCDQIFPGAKWPRAPVLPQPNVQLRRKQENLDRPLILSIADARQWRAAMRAQNGPSPYLAEERRGKSAQNAASARRWNVNRLTIGWLHVARIQGRYAVFRCRFPRETRDDLDQMRHGWSSNKDFVRAKLTRFGDGVLRSNPIASLPEPFAANVLLRR